METTNSKNRSIQTEFSVSSNTELANEQSLSNSKCQDKKIHNSALTAAALTRSAVGHAKAHRLTNRPGDFAHSATNICYEN